MRDAQLEPLRKVGAPLRDGGAFGSVDGVRRGLYVAVCGLRVAENEGVEGFVGFGRGVGAVGG